MEAGLFFTWIFVVLIWGFTTTVFCAQEHRYIPIGIMSFTLSICYIYVISKRCSARSIDWKFFKQSTMVFYASCLVTATQAKQKWRMDDRNTKSMSNFQGEEEFQDRTQYLRELLASQEWSKVKAEYKSQAGFLGIFEQVALKKEE